MNCPKCNETNVTIIEGYVQGDSMDADLYCDDCDETVAFHRIKDEEWIKIS